MEEIKEYCQYWTDDANGVGNKVDACGKCKECLEWMDTHNERWLY